MILRAFLIAGLAVHVAVPADDVEPTGLGCIENLEVPRYPPLARQARIDGLARVQWSDGQWQMREAKPGIFSSIARQIGASARVKKVCQDRTVALVFEFRIRTDSPAGKQDDRVTLVAPNRMLITSNPAEMNY